METFSALLALCAGNSPVTGEFPAQRPVTRSFDVFFDLRLNKRLSKQSWSWWFETPSRPLWRHCNAVSWLGWSDCRPPAFPPFQVDVIKWKHFSRHWPFVRGIHRSTVDSPRKGQWLGALFVLFDLQFTICWANNPDACNLRRHRAHYDVTGMHSPVSIWNTTSHACAKVMWHHQLCWYRKPWLL